MQPMLWIVRHAEAGPTTDAKDDDKRPLSAIGRKQAQAAGIALAKMKTPIQTIISSTLRRGAETAELIDESLKLGVRLDKRLNGLPCEPDEVCQGHGNCLIVSHEPSCSLICYRTTGTQMRFAKGAMAQLHEGEMWGLINPSAAMIMAGMSYEGDPQSIDSRDEDLPLEVRQAEFGRAHRLDPWYV